MAPGCDFPHVGCNDVPICPSTFGHLHDPLKVLGGFVMQGLCRGGSQGMGCSRAVVHPPSQVVCQGHAFAFHHCGAGSVEGRVDAFHACVDVICGGEWEEGGSVTICVPHPSVWTYVMVARIP